MYKPYFKSVRHIIIFSLFMFVLLLAGSLFIATIAYFFNNPTKPTDEAMNDPLFTVFVIVVLLIPLFFIIFFIDLIFYFVNKKKAIEAQKNPEGERINQMEVNIEPTTQNEENKQDVSELKVVEKSDNVFPLKTKEHYTYGDALLMAYFVFFWSCVAIFFVIALTTATIAVMFNLNHLEGIILPTCIGSGAALAFALFIFFFGTKSLKDNFNNNKVDNLVITLYDEYFEQSMHQENLKAGLRGNLRYNLYYKNTKYMETKNHTLFKTVINKTTVMLMLDKKEDAEVGSRIISKIKEVKAKK